MKASTVRPIQTKQAGANIGDIMKSTNPVFTGIQTTVFETMSRLAMGMGPSISVRAFRMSMDLKTFERRPPKP
jgi:hypothetical protein